VGKEVKSRMHTSEKEKAMKTAAPPKRGVGFLCVFMLLGLSISPVFMAMALNIGVSAKEAANAIAKQAAYKKKLENPI